MNCCRYLGGLIALCVTALVGGNHALRADDPVGEGTAIVAVRGPQGGLIQSRPVHIFRVDPGSEKGEIPQTVTDAQGCVSVSLTAGLRRLRVAVPGVGFGSTGVFVVRPHETVSAAMPPLAAFGRLVGTVPVALRAPGEIVRVGHTLDNDLASVSPPAAVDDQGRFELTDVSPGPVEVVLNDRAGHRQSQSITADPGETRTVTFASSWPISGPVLGTAPPAESTTSVSLRGTVTDTSGKPVSGASVYALVPEPNPPMLFSGRRRPAPDPLTAVTGEDGRYVISHVVLGSHPALIRLWAEHPGMPLAELPVRTRSGQTDDLIGDLVLPTQHTLLTVCVLQRGRGLTGARVSVWPPDGSFPRNVGGFDDYQTPLHRGMTATTGAGGTVRFVDLPPGLWNVRAEVGKYPDVATADRRSVSVQVNTPASCELSISSAPAVDLGVLVSGPEGHPLDGQNGNFGGIRSVGSGGWGVSEALKRVVPGQYHAAPKQPGLYQVAVHTRDFVMPNMGWYGETEGTYLDAFGLIAVSDSLPLSAPLSLQAFRHTPATLHIRLRDASGKSAHGTVIVGGLFDRPDYAATTDGHGNADFPDMPSGQYTLRGYIAGRTSPMIPSGSGPMPPETALTGQTLIEPLKVTIGSDETLPVTLRPQPVGYIRLHLAQMPVEELKDFYLSDTSRPQSWQDSPGQHVDARTGDILYGPTPVGQDTLYVQRRAADGSSVTVGTASVMVRQNEIAAISLTPLVIDPAASHDPDVSDPVTGTVLLSGGTKPAWNAHAILCQPVPGLPRPRLTSQQPADASGRLIGMPSFLDEHLYDSDAPVIVNGRELPALTSSGSVPDGPVIVAWLPGLTGAAIVPYVRGQAVHIVLPPAQTATGKVTVAGQSVAGLPSTFRVRAACQSHGLLNDLLTLDATAEADGTFALPGLTPGTYQIQAIRDGIWLSATQTLIVGSSPLVPLTLDIPVPGRPLTLHLTDTQGHPLPGRIVALDSPGSPLAAQYWPRVVTADGNGDLHLDGLGVGRHILGDPWAAAPAVLAAFDVPPLSGTGPRIFVQMSVMLAQATAKWEKP